MKEEKGITLTSLVIYIIVMILIIGVMSSVSLMFYQNNKKLTDDTVDIIEYNNFNHYFISEIKTANNAVDQIGNDGTYIVFKSGNSFSLKDNKIYFNTVEIAKDVNSVQFSYYTDTGGTEHKDIITVNIVFGNYSNQMNYKIEEIY